MPGKVIAYSAFGSEVDLSEMATLAADRILGRANGAGTGIPQALTAAQVLTLLGLSTPGTGGNAVLDDASADAVLTTLGFPATFIHGPNQRVWPCMSLQQGGNFTMIDNSAYFVYVGQVARALTPLYVRGQMVTAGTTQTAAEIGLFTTPNAGGTGNQTLTPIGSAFKTTLDDLTAVGPLIRGNSVALAVALTVGVHLWVGIRIHMTGMPVFAGCSGDRSRGFVLVTASAAAFDGSTTYAGVTPALAAFGTSVGPYLWAGFD